MVSLSLSDELTFHEGGHGLTVEADPGTRAESLPEDEGSNLISRALAAVGRQASVHVVKRIPLGGGLGGGSTDAAAVLRWAGCSDPERRPCAGVRRAVQRGRRACPGRRQRARGSRRCRSRSGTSSCWFPRSGSTRRWSTPPGTSWPGPTSSRSGRRSEGVNALTEAALAVEPRLALWRDALRELTGRQPTLAGSGSTWFVDVDASPGSDTSPWLTLGEERGPPHPGTNGACGMGRDVTSAATYPPGVASGWPSASSCASSCACACGAS